VDRVEELSKKKDVPMAQISIAWNMAKTVAPIVGTTSLKNLQEMIGMFSLFSFVCSNVLICLL
jgi:aryl-alcohol dehydrogenase-like predicted oxidoreductase